MDYLTLEKKIKEIFGQLYETGKIDYSKLDLSRNEYAKILEVAQNEGYIMGVKITKTKTYHVVWEDDARLTQKGVDFIHPNRTGTQSTNNFHFHNGDFRGAGFGSDITITNNWSNSLDDLKDYVSTLSNEELDTGNELVNIVEKGELKEGIFSRFVTFFEKHPNVVGLIGKAIVWSFSNSDKLPLL